ncbi:MAG: transporter substrate-binding domain-containing protein [Sneathiella sp.]
MKILRILSVAAALSFATSVSAETITIANGNDYAPFTDQKLKRGGIASHLVEEAFKAAGWTSKYKWLPWKRGYDLTKKAEIDAAIPWAHNEERAPFFLFSDSIMSMNEQIWASADSNAKSYSDLEGKKGCLPLGYIQPDYLVSMMKAGTVKLDTPKDMTTCFKKLQAKRIDFIIANSMQAASIIKKAAIDPNSVKPAITSPDISEAYVIVSKDHPKGKDIIAAFNKGLAALKASGEYDAIVASH